MRRWPQALTEVDRVRSRTDSEVLAGLDAALRGRVARYGTMSAEEIAARLEELDREWDIERVLIVNASTLATLGVLAGFRRRLALLLPLAVGSFLLQHGLQGWCPPLSVFRRLGISTRREIDVERYAIKVLRGDLPSPADQLPADTVLDLAAKR
jgi:hypothetical protein